MFVLLFFTFLSLAFAKNDATTPVIPEYSIEKLEMTPDLMQSLPEAGLPDGGVAYCAPVAVSNSLVWLARNGYEHLAPIDHLDPPSQGHLAFLLGTKKYMHTTFQDGTGAKGIMEGVERYVRDKGYSTPTLRYQGWNKHPQKYSTGVHVPQLNWVKSGIIGKSAVWLKIGWYKYSPLTDEYRIFAGHWVALVGYGRSKDGTLDPNVLIIHDSAPRSGPILHHDYVKLEKLDHGILIDKNGAINAAGFYRLSGDLKIKDGADAGILDAAIVMKMN